MKNYRITFKSAHLSKMSERTMRRIVDCGEQHCRHSGTAVLLYTTQSVHFLIYSHYVEILNKRNAIQQHICQAHEKKKRWEN